MGQTIEIKSVKPIDRVLIIDTDRSLTGQDGESFTGPRLAAQGETFPAHLAVRLFESDEEIDYVHVMSNAVSVRRRTDWDESSQASATEVVSEFFRVYPD
ncbi:MAG: hypothetical protein R3324_12850 [Halobacteriales archaeon]|nr:hypothetical protein [Halobacteriales archaeon]